MLCTDEIEPSGPDLVAPAPPGALGPASPTTRELDDAYKYQELAALRTAHETLRADHEELLATRQVHGKARELLVDVVLAVEARFEPRLWETTRFPHRRSEAWRRT